MYQSGTPNAVLIPVFVAIALSLALAILGFVLRRRGKLRTRGAGLGWALLTVVPLFGAGLAMYTRHQVGMARGETQPGVNNPPYAPR